MSPELAVGLSRLIPAHAGKTVAAASRPNAVPAHPRSRGENTDLAVRNHLTKGSSPLTRGKRMTAILPGAAVRLIPAHAGKTPGKIAVIRIGQAHPRSRGENTS